MRFDDRRQQDDLDRAITALRDAARAADTSGDATCAECHEALGNGLYDRYQLTSSQADQDAAVVHLRCALDLIPPDDPDARVYASNLASALLDRFEDDDERAALDEAVGLLEAGLPAAGGKDDASSDLLTNFGNAMRLRAVADASVVDVERAVDLLARAVGSSAR